MNKIAAFEYFLKRLVGWYCDFYNIPEVYFNTHEYNNLSKLKVFKLHFFAASTDDSALDIFDFYALPYGHVESDLYNHLDDLSSFKVTNSKLHISVSTLDGIVAGNTQDTLLIDKICANLRARNNALISLNPFDLVELSHSWFSWKYTFNEARKLGQFSKPISKELIKQENKIYSL